MGSMQKTTSRIFAILFVNLTIAACAPAEPVKWASGNPDAGSLPEESGSPDEIENGADIISGITQPPMSGKYFELDPKITTLAHGPAQFWMGCETKATVMGGYDSDTKCGRAYLFPNYAIHLNKYFMGCVDRAASRAGFAKPQRVFIKHFGSYNDRDARGSSSLSMHAYARAIDVVNINLFDSAGKLTRFSTNVRDYKGANAVFYDEFRQCWKEKVPAPCKPSNSEGIGSIWYPGF